MNILSLGHSNRLKSNILAKFNFLAFLNHKSDASDAIDKEMQPDVMYNRALSLFVVSSFWNPLSTFEKPPSPLN